MLLVAFIGLGLIAAGLKVVRVIQEKMDKKKNNNNDEDYYG